MTTIGKPSQDFCFQLGHLKRDEFTQRKAPCEFVRPLSVARAGRLKPATDSRLTVAARRPHEFLW